MKKPQCSRCGRPLTDPYSVAVGMGPECRGGLQKKGWKFPKPKFRAHQGRVVFEGVTGKVERPAAKDESRKQKAEDEKESDDAKEKRGQS